MYVRQLPQQPVSIRLESPPRRLARAESAKCQVKVLAISQGGSMFVLTLDPLLGTSLCHIPRFSLLASPRAGPMPVKHGPASGAS